MHADDVQNPAVAENGMIGTRPANRHLRLVALLDGQILRHSLGNGR